MIPAIYPVTAHTDHVGPGTWFVVVRGLDHNGCAHIAAALQKGARKIVVDQDISQSLRIQIMQKGASILRVSDCRKALAQLSAAATDHAHQKLKIIGITGTKGKTTSAHLLFHMLRSAGIRTGLLSTVSNAIGDAQFAPSLTTPQPDYLHQFFNQAVAQGVEWVVMEVAAQAISLHRIDGLLFDAVIMTNFDREHLEFYDSMDAYFTEKKKLLAHRRPGAPAWINKDDQWLSKIASDFTNWFSCRQPSQLSGAMMPSSDFSLSARIAFQSHEYAVECSTLSGEYNLSNVLAAAAGGISAGISMQKVQESLANFPGIAGRQERYTLANGATALIDYAHNPLSYREFFKTISHQSDHLIVVFGAGGERDPDRRPEMGAIVAQYADTIIITDDNPRREDPRKIMQDIMRGIPEDVHDRVHYEADRKKAIETARSMGHAGSLIAVLGKGPDEYQIIGDQKMPFSDRGVLLHK